MTLFAQLITKHLETGTKLSASQVALVGKRETSEPREQFIAVLGWKCWTSCAAPTPSA